MNEMPGGQLRNRLGTDSATPSELFPVLSKRNELITKGLSIPVGIAFLFGMIPTVTAAEPEIFRNVLGVGIGLSCFYVLYLLGGKKKSWVFGLLTCFLGASLFAGAALAQQNFSSPTIKSADGSTLCLAANGGAANGTPIIVSDCVTGGPAQGFAVGSDGRLHFGASNGAYCVAPSSIQLQSPVQLWPCSSAPAPQTAASQSGSVILQFSGPTGELTCVGFGNNAPGSGVQTYLCSINSPTFTWTPLAAAASTVGATSSAATIFVGIDSSGYMLDQNHNRIVSGGAGNHLVLVQNGKLISQDGSGIVASGAGNVLSTNGSSLQWLLVDSSNKAYVVSNDGGSFSIRNSALAIVASGAGNIVASGAGNFSVNQQGTLVFVAAPGITGLPGGAILGENGSGYTVTAMAFPTAMTATGIVPAGASTLMSAMTVNSVNALVASALANPAPAKPTAPTYTVSGLTPSSTSWPTKQSMPFQWQHAGAPGTSTVSFFFQFTNGSMLNLPSTKDPVSVNSVTIPATAWSLTSNSGGTLMMKDDATGQLMASTAMTLTVPAPFQLTGLTAATSSWQLPATLPISWTYNGPAPANDTVNINIQVTGGAAYRMATGIPLTAAMPYQLPAPSGFASGTQITLSIQDASTQQTISRSGAISLIAAPGATSSNGLRLTGVATTLSSQNIWQLSSPLTVTWNYDGAIPPNDTVGVYLQLGGASSPLTQFAANCSIAAKSCTVPPQPQFPSSTGAIVTVKDLTGVSAQSPWTISLAAPTAPAPAPAPAPAAPAAVAIGQLAATATWHNLTPLTFTWSTSGVAPGNQSVILQMQAIGQTWKLTSPVWAGYKTYQTATYNWQTILKTSQNVTLTLIDGASGKLMAGPLTVKVSIP